MKQTLKYIALLFLAITAFSCDEEDGFYNEKYITTSQFVSLPPISAYHTGDDVTITAIVPVHIQETGYPDLLDIYTTTGAEALTFSYIFEKQNEEGEWEYIEIPQSSVTVGEGRAQSGSFVLAQAVRNAALEAYFYEAGVRFDSPGNYRLSFGVNSDEVSIVEFRSESPGNNINLNLLSQIAGLNGQGFFNFTVAP